MYKENYMEENKIGKKILGIVIGTVIGITGFIILTLNYILKNEIIISILKSNRNSLQLKHKLNFTELIFLGINILSLIILIILYKKFLSAKLKLFRKKSRLLYFIIGLTVSSGIISVIINIKMLEKFSKAKIGLKESFQMYLMTMLPSGIKNSTYILSVLFLFLLMIYTYIEISKKKDIFAAVYFLILTLIMKISMKIYIFMYSYSINQKISLQKISFFRLFMFYFKADPEFRRLFLNPLFIFNTFFVIVAGITVIIKLISENSEETDKTV